MNPAKLLATIKEQEDKIHDLQTSFSAERLQTMGSVISNLEVQVKVLSDRHNRDVETMEQLRKDLAYWSATGEQG